MPELDSTYTLPRHIAVIMDGNGRWAKKQGAARIFGHKSATKSVREITEECAELGIEYLTLYAFSTENWSRPKIEVDALMELLVSSLRKELNTLMKNNVKLKAIGDISGLPKSCRNELKDTIEETSKNNGLTLTLALNYSGRWDILNATKEYAVAVKEGKENIENISEEVLSDYMVTKGIPDPELLIRTSGELRISNFLLWQLAYTELYFTDVLWPDFRKNHLKEALESYQKRERRFGNISEQV
ncbi:MAG: isoprenyl transferase [Bacteroidetes bacterium]|nr:MAG: isoprenyl transferase [Bacteroidota bacterium]